jgi:hypothetical protein
MERLAGIVEERQQSAQAPASLVEERSDVVAGGFQELGVSQVGCEITR